jgi:hypothetical protein
MSVGDWRVTGWMWGENLGWISLSCENTSSCGTETYGVYNDGAGHLSGTAWSENGGWIDFAPANGAGVTVDIDTGVMTGAAWWENGGWISFQAAGPGSAAVTVGWTCPATTPAPDPVRSAYVIPSEGSVAAKLAWAATSGPTAYDLVRGDLTRLRSIGDLGQAYTGCLILRLEDLEHIIALDPLPGEGLWYLVRPINCNGPGTWGVGGPEDAVRDAELAGFCD